MLEVLNVILFVGAPLFVLTAGLLTTKGGHWSLYESEIGLQGMPPEHGAGGGGE